MTVSKKLRFEIFRRDNFACRYCGLAAADGAVLEPDHVVPRARGGKDVATNLVTACDGCNSGKSDTPLSAPPIEDVLQDAFRAACKDRGVSDLHLGESLPPGLAAQILCNYTVEEREQIAESRRDWLDEEDDTPSVGEFRDMVAMHAYTNECCDRMRLGFLIERMLLMLPAEDRRKYERLAGELRSERSDSQQYDTRREAVVMAIALERLLDDIDQTAFLALPAEQQHEWKEYATAWYGHDPFDETRKPSEESVVRRAARIVKIYAAGQYYPIMCSGPGRYIAHCPRRAVLRIWLDDCSTCEREGVHAEGCHIACEVHAEWFKAKKIINDETGQPFSIRTSEPFDVSAKEAA